MSALKRPKPPDKRTNAYLSFVLRIGPLSKMEDPVEMTFRVQNVNGSTVEHFADANTAFSFICAAIDRFAQRPLH